MNPQERIEAIKQRLTAQLSPASLDIIDDSAKHYGHAGAQSGAGHFTVNITSSMFAGKTPIQSHRLVYDALHDMMDTEIHALKIKTQAL